MKSEESTWWRPILERYEHPQLARSTWQLCNSMIPYFVLWAAMIWAIKVSYLLTLAIAVLAAGFWIRIFIISHDCGHGSFFKSRWANRIWGAITGVITITPFWYWRREHAKHHGSSGNLDRRGSGDIWTLTLKEYRQAPLWERIWYRVYRNPLMMFGPGSMLLFLVRYRFTAGIKNPAEIVSVHATNLALLGIFAGMSMWIGLLTYLMILIPTLLFASSFGVWMFYVQHQFEGVYWERDAEWDYLTQAMEGSSFYKLPRVLQWFSGNIGFHHVHHLSHRIPNYNLEQCHYENEMFRQVKEITLLASLKSLTFRLWDEDKRELVSFAAVSRKA